MQSCNIGAEILFMAVTALVSYRVLVLGLEHHEGLQKFPLGLQSSPGSRASLLGARSKLS